MYPPSAIPCAINVILNPSPVGEFLNFCNLGTLSPCTGEEFPAAGFMIPAMKTRTGCLALAIAVLTVTPGSAQVLNNQSLTGKYYFRHVSLGTDGSSVTNLS